MSEHAYFFGVLSVARDAAGTFVSLTNGITLHGKQFTDPDRRREPLSYYARGGPAGDIFELARLQKVSGTVIVAGLGAGTLAGYATPAERWTFIEIDPAVIEVATNPALFTFLADAFPPHDGYDLVQADARLALERAPDSAGLLIIDAFASDAIPTHLLTVEAGRLYAARARLIALHVSNRHVDLSDVVARLARDIGWASAGRDDLSISDEEAREGKAASRWLLLAPTRENLRALPPTWTALDADDRAAWTDDATSLMTLLR